MKILAFDPGGTTGVCFSNTQNLKFDYSKKYFNSIVQWTDNVIDFLPLKECIEETTPDLVVVESFKLYPWKAKAKIWDDFEEVQKIGAIKLTCLANNIELVLQGANQKKFFKDKKLKEFNLYKNKTPHERDAIRHNLIYIMKNRI